MLAGQPKPEPRQEHRPGRGPDGLHGRRLRRDGLVRQRRALRGPGTSAAHPGRLLLDLDHIIGGVLPQPPATTLSAPGSVRPSSPSTRRWISPPTSTCTGGSFQLFLASDRAVRTRPARLLRLDPHRRPLHHRPERTPLHPVPAPCARRRSSRPRRPQVRELAGPHPGSGPAARRPAGNGPGQTRHDADKTWEAAHFSTIPVCGARKLERHGSPVS
jgi:hypothetical protein